MAEGEGGLVRLSFHPYAQFLCFQRVDEVVKLVVW